MLSVAEHEPAAVLHSTIIWRRGWKLGPGRFRKPLLKLGPDSIVELLVSRPKHQALVGFLKHLGDTPNGHCCGLSGAECTADYSDLGPLSFQERDSLLGCQVDLKLTQSVLQLHEHPAPWTVLNARRGWNP